MPHTDESDENLQEATAAIAEYLTSKNVPPTRKWLQDFASSNKMNIPMVALQKTALFRMLATDLTTSLSVGPQLCFPLGVSNAEVREKRLNGPVAVQVLDIEDVGHSRWSQVEAIEMEERGEMTKGREIVRVVAESENPSEPSLPAAAAAGRASVGPHKLLVQDASGSTAYAFELESVKGIDLSMSIGAKLILRDAVVARGVVLLEPRCVEILGGKITSWDKAWRDARKAALKAMANAGQGGS